MRILHIVPGLDDPTCGIAVAAKIIARQQSDEEHHEVAVVSSVAWTIDQLRAAEEVWVHSMWTMGVVRAAWRSLRLGKRLVRMPHGCIDPVKMAHHWHKKRWVAPIERWLFARAAVLVGTIPEELEQLKSFVPFHRGDIVLRSLSSTMFKCPASVPTRDSESLNILYIGRLHPLKGVRFLIRAMTSGMNLTVIGKDEGEGRGLHDLAIELGVTVTFRGIVSESEKNAAITGCDVLCLPTLSENFGLVVAEALQRGKRVITTDGAPAWEGQPGVVYLKGFRDGTDEERVRLLKDALSSLR